MDLSLWNIILLEELLAPNLLLLWKALNKWFCQWAWGPWMEMEPIKGLVYVAAAMWVGVRVFMFGFLMLEAAWGHLNKYI